MQNYMAIILWKIGPPSWELRHQANSSILQKIKTLKIAINSLASGWINRYGQSNENGEFLELGIHRVFLANLVMFYRTLKN